MKNGKMINGYGEQRWFKNDLPHREDGPAATLLNGDEFWYLDGLAHREGGPAIDYANGEKFWYLNGERLRHPERFKTMELWFEYLNDNESETYQLIHDTDGFISFIDEPSGKQTRVHQMAHML